MRTHAIAAVVLVGLLCFSCHKGGARGTAGGADHGKKLDLNTAIVGTPPSIVSVLAPVDITFKEPVVPSNMAGTVLDKSPFTFKPGIAGTAMWVSETQLRFTPGKPLPAGVAFKATLMGKTAFGAQRNVNDFSFSFKTAEQEVVDFGGDFEPDAAGQNMVRFKGHLAFAQPVAIKKISSDLDCRISGRDLKLSITPLEGSPNKVLLTSDPVKRGATGSIVTFSLPGPYSADRKKWSSEIMLPEINVFKVLAHMDMSDPKGTENVYAFRFSDPIRTGTDLSGYIKIEPAVTMSVSVDKKYLKLRGKFTIGRSYTVTIARGFPSAFGTKMADIYTATVELNNLKPELQWLSNGVYLPSDNNYKLQFKSVNVAKVRCQITQIFPDNLGFFVQNNLLQDKNAGKQDENEEYYYNQSGAYADLDRVGASLFDSTLAITAEKNKWVRSELDLAQIFKGKRNSGFVVKIAFTRNDLTGRCTNDRNDVKDGDLFYSEDNYYSNPGAEGYYYRKGTATKLLIASDIGLTLKKTVDGLVVYAVDIIDAKPAAGLSLGLYSYQNQLVERQSADQNGCARFAKADNGYYIRGESRAGLALMRLDQGAWEVSSFDVAGVDEGNAGTTMFIYADRGVHRPGDTVHLAAIVRNNRACPPENQPVKIEVFNALSQNVFNATQKSGPNGHVYFAIPTDIAAPTGSWRADLIFANQTFSHELKIETVKPNRLKVNIECKDTSGPERSSLGGRVNSRYLFGTPAAGLRAKLTLDCSEEAFSPAAWKEFTFTHPCKEFTRRNIDVSDNALDNNGTMSFSADIEDLRKAPCLIRGVLRAEVYERGGSFTANSKQVIISPYNVFVGMRNPFPHGYARTGEAFQLPVVAVDLHGKPVAGRKLKMTWYVSTKYWWWDWDNESHGSKPDFRTLETTYKIAEVSLVSGAKPVIQNLEVEAFNQNFIEVTDEESGHTSGFFFEASSWGYGPVAERKERAFLPISTDKNVYYTGDRMQVSFETPQQGLALFTLEQGRKILHQEIRTVTAGRTTFTLDVTDEMVPNCYAVVSLIQPHNQVKNDVPQRIYGVKPLKVEDFSSRLPITLTAPDEIRPGQTFSVSVSSKAPREATYTLAIVDDGLLDLTGFSTPDPWAFFFRKLRLGVETRDNMDEILGMLFPDMDRRFSIGGDMAEQQKRAGESKVQRFKPVVLYARPMAIKPGATVTTSFTMPNYVGSVRCMLVGAAGNSYVNAEKTIPVKQDLMLLTTVPRVARPGDRFAVPVSVFSTNASIDSASLSIKVSGPLAIVGSGAAGCRFSGRGEKDVQFMVLVKDQIGAGRIVIEASSRSFKASDAVDLPVTSPNPYFIKATDSTVLQNRPAVFVPRRFGIDGTNRARFSFARFPDIQIDKRYKYLLTYPFGCIEQTVSAGFPQLFLGSLMDLSPVEGKMATDNVNATIRALEDFRMDPGFAYWPSCSWFKMQYSRWGSLYALHFLASAKMAGYYVPDDLYSHAMDHARECARNADQGNRRYQCYAQFLLSFAGSPDQGSMNLVRENYLKDLDPLSRSLFAAAYALSGQKDMAAQALSALTGAIDIKPYREYDGSYGSPLRDRSLIAYCAYKAGNPGIAASALRMVAKEFTPEGWYSTQETAFALLAMAEIYAKSPMTGGDIDVTIAVKGGKPQTVRLKRARIGLDAGAMWDKEVTVSTATSSNPLFVTLFEEGIPVNNIIKSEQKGLELVRSFYDEDGSLMTLQSISQGKQFWVLYQVRSRTAESLKNLALSSLFPSGWEIINMRLEGTEPPEFVKNWEVSDGTYMDLRDDRVNWFFDLDGQEKMSFAVKCNPTFKGSYRLPPVTCEPMYSPDYAARIAADSVTVK